MNPEPHPEELRPTPALMKYYLLTSFFAGPFFFFPLIPLFARYRSLRYRIDEEGISMRWGVLFRREVSLNYARIQDIHLSSNLLERWLGLGKIQVQTASGSSGAEMTIEGVPDLDAMRDLLYSRMRGARGEMEPAGPAAVTGSVPGRDDAAPGATTPGAGPAPAADRAPAADELTHALRQVAGEIRALREELTGRDGPGGEGRRA